MLPRATVQVVGEGIQVELPRTAGFKSGAPLQFVSHGPDAALLIREGLASQGYFAGSLSSIGIAEALNLIVSGIRSGKLVVTRDGHRKTASFRDGQLVFASSTEPHERLGNSLVRRKIITARQLEEALAMVKPGAKLGQVLTRAKMLSSSALYAAMGDLAKEIVLGMFELTDGHFVFLEGGPLAEDNLKMRERTRDLILEGMRRAEEVSRLRRRFTPMLRLMAGAQPPPPEYDGMIALAARGAELLTLRSEFVGSEHAFLVTVQQLVEIGSLVEEPAPRPAMVRAPEMVAAPVPSPLEMYGSLIRTICSALKAAKKDLSELRSFFEDPLPGLEQPFRGVALSDKGELDVKRVLANCKAENEAMARAAAYEALDSFVSYALFSAKNVLPPDLAQSLAAEFRQLKEGVAE